LVKSDVATALCGAEGVDGDARANKRVAPQFQGLAESVIKSDHH
jgi:hypothetical protein